MITLTAKITLANGTEIALNKQNLLSLNSDIIDRADTILPSWGIISNGGNIRFVDSNGAIKSLAQSLQLTKEAKVNIYLKDTLTGSESDIGEYFTTQWTYDNTNFEVSVNITDGLQKMQDINIMPLEYDLSQIYNSTAKYIYDNLQGQTVSNGFNMQSSSELDEATLAHLEKITIVYPYIEETNLWKAWQNFAEAFQLHIYKNRQGKIVCVYRGND